MEANDISSWTTIYRDLLNAYNNTKHSSTGFAPNDIKKEDIDTVKKNIKKRGKVKKYEDINEGDSVRLQLKEKTQTKDLLVGLREWQATELYLGHLSQECNRTVIVDALMNEVRDRKTDLRVTVVDPLEDNPVSLW